MCDEVRRCIRRGKQARQKGKGQREQSTVCLNLKTVEADGLANERELGCDWYFNGDLSEQRATTVARIRCLQTVSMALRQALVEEEIPNDFPEENIYSELLHEKKRC